jgi:hypothetical protein
MPDCLNCGNSIQEGWKFCNECGTKLNEVLPPPPPPPESLEKVKMIEEESNLPPPPPPEPENTKEDDTEFSIESEENDFESEFPQNKTKSRKPLYALFALIIAMLIVFAALFIGFQGGKNSPFARFIDTDGDGHNDDIDAFIKDPDEWTDTDSDGVGDNSDAFPNDSSETDDTDSDGHGDNSDKFPTDSNEWDDSDADGYGDNGDAFPTDPNEQYDTDSDGIGDNTDEFPNDPSEWIDSDDDGIGDNSDPFPNDMDNDGFNDDVDFYSDGDAALKLDLTGFRVVDPIDMWPFTNAELYFVVYYDWDGNTEEWTKVQYFYDDDGEPWSVAEDVYYSINRDFIINVPDDVLNYYILIYAIDDDFSSDDLIDIDGSDYDSQGILLKYNINTQTWSGDDSDGIADGSDDGTGSSDDDDGILYYDLSMISINFEKTYEWYYDGYTFSINLNINQVDYVYNYSKNRVGFDKNDASTVQEYVTSEAQVVIDLANKLDYLADQVGYSYYEKVDFVLSFVQNIKYSLDNVSKSNIDYWRYPIEMLVEETGDCEDASCLFASLTEALGYDAVCFFLADDDSTDAHLAVGIYAESHSGEYLFVFDKKYYFCETTSPGPKMGDYSSVWGNKWEEKIAYQVE